MHTCIDVILPIRLEFRTGIVVGKLGCHVTQEGREGDAPVAQIISKMCFLALSNKSRGKEF